MKKLIAVCLLMCVVLGLCACGDTTPATTTEPTTTEPATETTTEAAASGYTVKVVDEGGNPVAGAMVQICQGESCLPGVLGADGTAIFQVAEADYKVSFLGGVPAGYEYTTEETEFYFDNYEVTIVLKAVA